MRAETREELVLGGLVVAALLLAVSAWSRLDRTAPYVPSEIDRRFAVEALNAYSDYSGWEARFDYELATVVMTGSLLCAEDFLEIVPPRAKEIVEANFEWFRCDYGNTHVAIRVRP